MHPDRGCELDGRETRSALATAMDTNGGMMLTASAGTPTAIRPCGIGSSSNQAILGTGICCICGAIGPHTWAESLPTEYYALYKLLELADQR